MKSIFLHSFGTFLQDLESCPLSGEQPPSPPPHQTHGKVALAGQHVHTGHSLTYRARRVCDHRVGTEYFLFLADRVLIRETAGTSEACDGSVCVTSLLPVLHGAQESFPSAFNLACDGWCIIRWSV